MMSLVEAARALGTRVTGADAHFHSVATDSRHFKAGSLFVALRGERFDGHEFVAAVARAGAAGAITPPPTSSGAAASGSPFSAPSSSASGQPAWANRFKRTQAIREGVLVAAHTLNAGDGGGASEGPNLKQRD